MIGTISRKGKLMELRPIRELRTEEGRREADHLSDFGVKDSSMAFIVDENGVELVTLTPSTYKRLTSKVGQANVFNPDYVAEDGDSDGK